MKVKGEILKIEKQDRCFCEYELEQVTGVVPLVKEDYEYARTRVGEKAWIEIYKGMGTIIRPAEVKKEKCKGIYEYLYAEEDSTEQNPIITYECNVCGDKITIYHPNRRPERCQK